MPCCLCLSDHSIFASYNDFLPSCRHFLFKTGTGTTPLFSTATPGYTMASGSVYSPPTRPLPRNTLSRSAFKFKKSSKYCSWKCTALCAVGVSVLLAILLSYFIGKSPFLELFCLYMGMFLIVQLVLCVYLDRACIQRLYVMGEKLVVMYDKWSFSLCR